MHIIEKNKNSVVLTKKNKGYKLQPLEIKANI